MKDLTIITATHNRLKHLARTIEAVKRQSIAHAIQHYVVNDAAIRDEEMAALCQHYKVSYAAIPHFGFWGAGCKDHGISISNCDYVAFWDDDNHYEDHAAETLLRAVDGYDIGVAQCVHAGQVPSQGNQRYLTIPGHWNGKFVLGDVDSMCVCVRATVAMRAKWGDHKAKGTDYHWLKKLQDEYGATVNFLPIVIGTHL